MMSALLPNAALDWTFRFLLFRTFIIDVFLAEQSLDCSINHLPLVTKEAICGDLLFFDDELFVALSLEQLSINSLTSSLHDMLRRFPANHRWSL